MQPNDSGVTSPSTFGGRTQPRIRQPILVGLRSALLTVLAGLLVGSLVDRLANRNDNVAAALVGAVTVIGSAMAGIALGVFVGPLLRFAPPGAK